MTDKYHNKQAAELIIGGTIKAVSGEETAFDGYMELAAGLSRHMAKYKTTQKATGALRTLIEDAKAQGKSFHVIHENLLVGVPNNPEDSRRASNLRAALLWMHEHPEQLAFAQERTASANPLTLLDKWKKHQSATIKEAVEQGDDHLKLADALDGVTQKEAKAMLDKAKDAKAKREAKAKAEPEPAPATDIQHMPADKLAVELARRPDFETILAALVHFNAQQAKSAGTASPEGSYDFPEGAALSEWFKTPQHTFAVFTRDRMEEPIATGRVLKKQRKVVMFTPERIDLEMDKPTNSERTVKMLVAKHLGYGGLGAFAVSNTDPKHTLAMGVRP